MIISSSPAWLIITSFIEMGSGGGFRPLDADAAPPEAVREAPPAVAVGANAADAATATPDDADDDVMTGPNWPESAGAEDKEDVATMVAATSPAAEEDAAS